MASMSANTPMVKLSFAKVAASANIPRANPQAAVKSAVSNGAKPAENGAVRGKESGAKEDVTKAMEKTIGAVQPMSETTGTKDTISKPAKRNSKLMPIPIFRAAPEVSPATSSSITSIKQQGNDDGSTQLSSSDGRSQLRQPAFDNKSVASATTYQMDEKESLWPDDSASIRAREEEESAPGTGAPESRTGSDTEARAFSEQLREISTMAPQPVAVEQLTPSVTTPLGAQFEPAVNAASMGLPAVGASRAVNPILLRPDVMPIPDDKLMEALASHRDRLFVLKLEQDIIDFLKDSKETQLVLPQTNSFYRMLAHKLADYYFLQHTVETNDTGAAVVIVRTSVCRFPPPLSAIPNSQLTNQPPPPITNTTRKIMRRGGDASGTATSANSEGPSKTTSEAGDAGSNGSELGVNGTGKSKKALTREEREAKYKEARERIFGSSVPDGESTAKDGEPAISADLQDAENSRSSSAAGNKKQKAKKQRAPIDDDFEPRSQFAANMYVQPGYGMSVEAYPMSAGYYPGHPAMMVNSPYGMMPQPQMQAMYGGGYPPMMSPTGSQGPFSPTTPSYSGMQGPEHQLAAQFQHGMQSFQDAPSPGAQMLSNGSVAPPDQSMMYASQPSQGYAPPWQQPMGYPQYYANGMMAGAPGPQQSMHMPNMAVPAPYQMYGNGMNGYYQQMNGNRASFNPQIQSFVPHIHSSPMMPQMSTPRVSHQQHVNMNQRSYTSSPQAPHSFHSSPRQPMPTTPNLTHPSLPSLPPNPMMHGVPPNGMQRTPSGQHSMPMAGPMSVHASPNYTHSSIAKWGTPAHLPPKPPPPNVNMEPQKYHDPQGRGLPRVPSTGPPSAAKIVASGKSP